MSAFPSLGYHNRRNVVGFIHKVTTSTSGTIGSQDAPGDSGVIAAKTGSKTGRYTLTLPSKFRKFHGGFVSVIGPDDTADSFLRDNDVDGGDADGTIEVQFARSDTEADAELMDGAIFIAHLFVEI